MSKLTYIHEVRSMVDKADRVPTFQRAMHYRQKMVYLVITMADGHRLSRIRIRQAEANRLITEWSSANAGTVAAMTVEG